MTSRILLIPLSWLSLSLLAQEALPKTAETFDVGGHKAFLSAAPMPAEGKPWLWYAPTLKSLAFGERKGYFETFAKAGISIAGYDIGEVRGSPTSTAKFTLFYDEMVKRGYSPKPILLGQSRGGLRSSYLAALDDRIKATIVSSWMCSFPNQIAAHIRGIGFTEIIPGMYHHMDHPDIASLAMPKPLMVINGSQDRLFELAGVHASHEKLAKCYAKAGVPEHFKSIIEDAPHQFNAERQADAWAWFEKWV